MLTRSKCPRVAPHLLLRGLLSRIAALGLLSGVAAALLAVLRRRLSVLRCRSRRLAVAWLLLTWVARLSRVG